VAALPDPILDLAQALNKLPGIGPRSAERLALHLVQSEPGDVRHLADALVRAREKIRACPICGALTELAPCGICQDPRRDASILCIVERPTDILSIEKAGSFRGRYHVLGGRISPLEGVGPEDLRIAELEHRFATEPIHELILALATDVEGDATSGYLAKRLGSATRKVTRLAHGLPAGSCLEYADELTVSRANQGRRELYDDPA
jgi:recombination protein RecR